MSEEDLITLITDDGRELEFIKAAGLYLNDIDENYYTILVPATPLEGMEEGQGIVFRLWTDEEENDHYEIEDDPAVIDAVFEAYERMYDEMTEGD